MGVRPIIEVDVNDAEFRRFYDLFAAYAAELDEMPAAWHAIGEAMGESSKDFEASTLSAKDALAVAAAQAGIIAEAIREATKATNGLDKSTAKGAQSMDRLRKGAEGVGKAISAVGGWILKIGALGGLGAIFSGVGIGDLASSAFRRYRQAGQLGITPGALASFQVNAQQFLTTSALEASANAQNDISKAGYLAVLGIRYSTARAMSTSDLAFAELKAARAAYLQNPALAMQNPAIQSYLSLGGSFADVRNAATLPLSQLLTAQNKTRSDAQAMGFSAQTGQAWSNLEIALGHARVSIETDLINKLGPLAPELTKLTEGVIDAVGAFIGGKGFDGVIKDVKWGIGELADFVKKTPWKRVGDTFYLAFQEIEAVAKKFSWLVPNPGKPKTATEKVLSALNPFQNAGDIRSGAAWNSPENRATLKALGIGWSGLMHFLGSPFQRRSAGNDFAWAQRGAKSLLDGVWANNPLNEKVLTPSGRAVWGHFGSLSDGIRANAHLLKIYGNQNLDTLAKIIPTWAPAGDGNNPSGYIANVEKWSGVSRNLPMSKWTKAQFAAVISAMSREEGTDQVSIAQVVKALYSSDLSKIERSGKAHSAAHHTVRVMPRKQRQRPPVHVSVSNSTAARVAVSVNAVAAS